MPAAEDPTSVMLTRVQLHSCLKTRGRRNGVVRRSCPARRQQPHLRAQHKRDLVTPLPIGTRLVELVVQVRAQFAV